MRAFTPTSYTIIHCISIKYRKRSVDPNFPLSNTLQCHAERSEASVVHTRKKGRPFGRALQLNHCGQDYLRTFLRVNVVVSGSSPSRLSAVMTNLETVSSDTVA